MRMLEGECAGEFRHDLLNGGQHAFGEETVIIEDRTNAKRHSSDQQLEHVVFGLITSMSRNANAMASGECSGRTERRCELLNRRTIPIVAME